MRNPYEDIFPPESLRLERRSAWVITLVFLLFLLLPPIARHAAVTGDKKEGKTAWLPLPELMQAVRPATAAPGSGTEGIAKRLRAYETRLEETSDYAAALRRGMQQQLTAILREGNAPTIIGNEGWLYFRPAVQALTGYGPIVPEPQSVAKDPSRGRWNPPLAAIEHFAGQLQERGIELVLVPAPVKPMLYPEHLTGHAQETPVRHRDSAAFFDKVQRAGVTVIDVTDTLWAMKKEDATAGEVFLKQDTHWRPRGMQAAAAAVASHLKARPWFRELAHSARDFRTETVSASHPGDLVEKLDLPEGASTFPPETATLTRVLDAATGEPLAPDPMSPIVVLGDSFVNVFHDPGLGFAVEPSAGSEAAPVMGSAGFAQHLALQLGHSPDVIAINGEAATGVRAQFARRHDDEVRAKKAVVWVIAARDLFLSETPANGLVRWDNVPFQSAQKPANPTLADNDETIHVHGTVTDKATIRNPRDVPYKDALFVIELEISPTENASLPETLDPGTRLPIVLWAFKNRTLTPESNLAIGQKIRAQLVPWTNKTPLHTTTLLEEPLLVLDALWFAEQIEAH